MNRIKMLNAIEMFPKTQDLEILREQLLYINYEIGKYFLVLNKRKRYSASEVIDYIESKRHLENCLVAVKGLIDSRENIYIEKHPNEYKQLIEDLGRWGQRTDASERQVETSGGIVSFQKRNILSDVQVRLFAMQVKVGMENLVMKPIINVNFRFTRTYLTNEGKEIIKDKNLYGYWLFLELINAVEFLGVTTRMEGARKMVINDSLRKPSLFPINPLVNEGEEQEFDISDIFGGDNELEESLE